MIGHIINYKYVSIEEDKANKKKAEPDRLSYGASAFVHSVSSDLYSDLLDIFSPDDACTMMAIAAIRVFKPGICSERISAAYQKTFVSLYWPGANVSSNSISKLFDRIGKLGPEREKFYAKRAASVMKDHHVVERDHFF